MEQISLARFRKKLSISTMARLISMSRYRLKDLLAGHLKEVSEVEISRIASILGLSVDVVRAEIAEQCRARRVEAAREAA